LEKQASAGFWLSPQQEHVWLLQEGNPLPYRAICAVQIEGSVRDEALRTAVNQLIARHEILRTAFCRQPGMKVPFQVIHQIGEPTWRHIDLRGVAANSQAPRLEDILVQERKSGFDFANGPMLRITSGALSAQKLVLLFTLPAI
jgi:Condensation domain